MLDKEVIVARSNALLKVAAELKAHFIGIDEVIDELIAFIRVWYVAPEVLRRPVVINLWGMTGVGKTDLIRRMVSLLHLQNRFVEIELSNIDASFWASTVGDVFENYRFHDGNPAIVLFDEIQRFNTINPDGSPIEQTKYPDFWELLSDGKLSQRRRSELDNTLFNYKAQRADRQATLRKTTDATERANLEVVEKQPIGLWEARGLEPYFRQGVDVDELATKNQAEVIEMLEREKRKGDVYEPRDHRKTLVIISGNLDEAFTMAGQTAEIDVDADVFHAFTKKITVVNIKNALSRKFRPEQVARFGNMHIIYPSLRRTHFESLIERELGKVSEQNAHSVGIQVDISSAVRDLIYRNGVFPVQGVRPVFSSVTDIVDSTLAPVLVDAIVQGATLVRMDYDDVRGLLTFAFNEVQIERPFRGRIDRIRHAATLDQTANVSVHEAGHAVAHAVLFGIAPMQLRSKTANPYAAGYTFAHDVYKTRESLLRMVNVLLAGGIAEELVFGNSFASTGRASDREQATVLVLDYIRRYGFDEEFQAAYVLETTAYKMEGGTDVDAEKLITRLVGDTRELLNRHREFLLELARALEVTGELDAVAVQTIAQKFAVKCEVRPEGYQPMPSYQAKLAAAEKASLG
jgi:Peptidase family M41/ATPase family associated with various cellular activities (AAA)